MKATARLDRALSEEDVGYDEESRTIMSGGGAVVIFAYGFVPTLVDFAQVRIGIITSAFTAQISSNITLTSCQTVGGYSGGFLEKSTTEHWAKYVMVVG